MEQETFLQRFLRRKQELADQRELSPESYFEELISSVKKLESKLGVVEVEVKPLDVKIKPDNKFQSAVLKQNTQLLKAVKDLTHILTKGNKDVVKGIKELKPKRTATIQARSKVTPVKERTLNASDIQDILESNNSPLDDFDIDVGRRRNRPGRPRVRRGGRGGRGGRFGGLRTAGGKALSFLGRNAVRGGAIGASLLGAYNVYNDLSDDTKSTEDKTKTVAREAGGVAGATAGAALGATVGSVVPVVGTALGGLAGGAAGYFGGTKAVDAITTTLTAGIEKAGLGDMIGRTAAAVMAPFSKEAREALKLDFSNVIVPKFESAVEPIKESTNSLLRTIEDNTEALESAGALMWGSVKEAGNKLIQSTKEAGSQIAAGYQSGGLKGAIGAIPGAASTLGSGAAEAGAAVKGGFETAYRTVAGAKKGFNVQDVAAGGFGALSAFHESGGKKGLGVGTVSQGNKWGDVGGVSYGAHQFSSAGGSGKGGTMAVFLRSKEGQPYAQQLAGLAPGTAAFSAKYKEIAATQGKAFDEAQTAFLKRTHYDPAARTFSQVGGIKQENIGKGMQELLMSLATAEGAGGAASTLKGAFAGKDASKMSEEEQITTLQDYRKSIVGQRYKSSNAKIQAGWAQRDEQEKAEAIALAQAYRQAGGTEQVAKAEEQKGQAIGATGGVKEGSAVASAKPKMVGGKAMPQYVLSSPSEETKALLAKAETVSASDMISRALDKQSKDIDAKYMAIDRANQETKDTIAMATSKSKPEVSATPAPIDLVAPTVPPEVPSVNVANQVPPVDVAAANAKVPPPGTGGTSSLPTLNEIPLMVSDMGLVLLNIGHIALACMAVLPSILKVAG